MLDIAGLIAFGFSLSEVANMELAELEMWAVSSAEYTRMSLGVDGQDQK